MYSRGATLSSENIRHRVVEVVLLELRIVFQRMKLSLSVGGGVETSCFMPMFFPNSQSPIIDSLFLDMTIMKDCMIRPLTNPYSEADTIKWSM